MEKMYKRRKYMTYHELKFYNILKELEKEDYIIIPQVNLGTIINKIDKEQWRNELFKNIDFAIFNKNFEKVLLLIELNDKSHLQKDRKERDWKVKNICKTAGIDIMTFISYYSNRKNYVINRVKTYLNSI